MTYFETDYRLVHIRPDSFSERTKGVFVRAQLHAGRSKHNYIGPEHLLHAIITGEGDDPSIRVLENIGVDFIKVRGALFLEGNDNIEKLSLTPQAIKVIELAADEAERFNSREITPLLILIAILADGEGLAAGVLEASGVTLGKLRAQAEK